ncbi:MAG: hypothetical protein LBG27_14355 [Spirochaetaceae bacterium]|jgi:hypothetical protein|nr:hypothetical protein [Spirochaetaceae bacterium]
MKEMTDEEADYWDEYYTKNPPRVDPAKNGEFAKLRILDRLSEDYLLSMTANKPPARHGLLNIAE